MNAAVIGIALAMLAVAAAILRLELRKPRYTLGDIYDEFLPPASRELRVEAVADAFWAAESDQFSWEHAYALAVLAVDVLELEEASR